MSYYLSFLQLSDIRVLAWSIPLIILLLALKTKAAAYLLLAFLLIFPHSTVILCIIFAKERKTKGLMRLYILSMKSVLRIALGRAYYFILPYMLITIAGFAVLTIPALLLISGLVPEKAVFFVMILLVLFYIAWIRFYLVNVVEDILDE